MSRADDLRAALAKNSPGVERLAKLGTKRNAQQNAALAIDLLSRDKQWAELVGILSVPEHTAPAPIQAPAPAPNAGGLVNGNAIGSTVVYLPGGSPGNPNGPDWTEGDACQWWDIVFRERVNYQFVRPVLLPGSHVLTQAGVDAAAAIVADPTSTVAPPDWNPLNLPLIP